MPDVREIASMKPTRRRFLTASAGLALPRAVAAQGTRRRSLTFAAPGGLFQELYEPAVMDVFANRTPGSGVFWQPIAAGSQALAVLRRQRERPDIDVVLLELATARQAADEGLLEPLTLAQLPVMAELAPVALFPGLPGPALFTEPLVLLYDAALSKPPLFWKSLWGWVDERSLAIPAPPDPVGIAFTIAAARVFGDGGDETKAISAAVNAIADLGRRTVTWDPRPDVYHVVGDGQARLGVGWNMAAQVFSDRMAGRLGVVFPEEGTLSRVVTVNLVKGAPKPEAARLLIAWLLGADAQKTMVERMYLGPVNTKGRYADSALRRTANTPARVARAMRVDWVAVNVQQDDILRRWREQVLGAG